MAENLILACYLLFSGCIVVVLLNAYWKELRMSIKRIRYCPRLAYRKIRRWFKIDTPAKREWSLVKTGMLSALVFLVYFFALLFFPDFVSLFPGPLVITLIAIPVAWILWIWRNQDKLRTLKNTEKELAWKEDDRLWNNFFERQKIADDKSVPENVRNTAIYALEPYLKLDEETRFPGLTRDFLFNILQDVKKSYQKRLNGFLWGMILFGPDIRDVVETRRSRVVTELLYPKGIDSDYILSKEGILYPELDIWGKKFIVSYFSFAWLPFCFCSQIKFGGEWRNGEFSLSKFRDCKFVPKTKFLSCKFIEVNFESVTAVEATFSSCKFLYATWSGNFQKCIFTGILFVGIHREKINDALVFQENQFDHCDFINSADLLASIIDNDKSNDCKKIRILQFPQAFIKKYKDVMITERLNSYRSMHIQVWTRYLYSPIDKNIIISDSIDLYHEYKIKRENMGIEEKQGQPLPWTKIYMVSDLFDSLFHAYKEQLPFLKELLEMAYYFEKAEKFDWQMLHHAFDDKRAEFEPEPVTSSAELR